MSKSRHLTCRPFGILSHWIHATTCRDHAERGAFDETSLGLHSFKMKKRALLKTEIKILLLNKILSKCAYSYRNLILEDIMIHYLFWILKKIVIYLSVLNWISVRIIEREIRIIYLTVKYIFLSRDVKQPKWHRKDTWKASQAENKIIKMAPKWF